MKQYLIATLLLLLNFPVTSWSQCTNDVIPPVAQCRDITVVLSATGTIVVNAFDIDANSTDNCGISAYSINGLARDTFTCADVGINTVILTVVDSSGNADTCTSNIIVVDNGAPTASCNTTTAYLNAAGFVVVLPASINNGSTDNCGLVTAWINGGAQDTFYSNNVGNNVVTLTVQDASNNTSFCQATVQVLDTIAPTVICVDITVYLTSNGQFFLPPSAIDGGSSDAGGLSSLRVNGQDSVLLSTTNVGTNPVTLVATDVFGNSSTCVALVTVIDTFSNTTAVHLIDPQAIDLTIFPNPASEQLTIQVVDAVIEQVQLTSITGQVLVEQAVQGGYNVVLPVQQLPKGMYIATVITNKGRLSQKVSIK